MAAGLNAVRGSGPNRSHALGSALTRTVSTCALQMQHVDDLIFYGIKPGMGGLAWGNHYLQLSRCRSRLSLLPCQCPLPPKLAVIRKDAKCTTNARRIVSNSPAVRVFSVQSQNWIYALRALARNSTGI